MVFEAEFENKMEKSNNDQSGYPYPPPQYTPNANPPQYGPNVPNLYPQPYPQMQSQPAIISQPAMIPQPMGRKLSHKTLIIDNRTLLYSIFFYL